MNRKRRILDQRLFLMFFMLCSLVLPHLVHSQPGMPSPSGASNSGAGPVMILGINGTINPATDDMLKMAVKKAVLSDAKILVLKLNTPGGLLPSMQSMVETLLDSPVPTAVYVTPQGGGAMSAGVFLTLAGNFAVMAPGTTIGAAHPVLGDGQSIQGDMREKIENSAVSLIRAIAEQRGRNVKWAEAAVRESVSITDREALAEGVIDFIASDFDRLLTEIEGKTVTVKGVPRTLSGLMAAPREELEPTLRQKVANILSDPNIAILLGLGAMLGIGIELYHPGAIFPGVFGVICLILSLIAGQVIPINTGGLALLGLAVLFFAVELFMPSFGIWGVAGLLCMILGSIYFVDTDEVWTSGGFAVNRWLVGSIAAVVGAIMIGVGSLVVRSSRAKVTSGREGMIDQVATVVVPFSARPTNSVRSAGPLNIKVQAEGKVQVMGEIWNAVYEDEGEAPQQGDRLLVSEVRDGMKLSVRKFESK